jgi:Tetratricopeptide repeat
MFYEARGRLNIAEKLIRRALETRTASQGEEHHSTLATQNCLGIVLTRQGKNEQAEAVLQ